MQKFKEMVEAKLNGESAKDLVSGIKITETRVGDFFRAAKAGYDSYKSARKAVSKSARKAVSSGGSANPVVNKNKGKDSTNSFSTSGTAVGKNSTTWANYKVSHPKHIDDYGMADGTEADHDTGIISVPAKWHVADTHAILDRGCKLGHLTRLPNTKR